MRTIVYDIGMTTRFRGITRRQGMLLASPMGWAEWSPFPEYDDAMAARWLQAALEITREGLPKTRRSSVPVNAIVSAVGPEAAAARVRDAGCATVKVKVAEPGESLEADLARVEAVRGALGPAGAIRVDANMAWDPQTAATALRELSQFGLEYAEQPCRTVAELGELRRLLDSSGTNVLLAADESIRLSAEPLLVRDVADVAIIKVQPLGGIRRSLQLVEELAMPAVVSSAVETSIGLNAGVFLAAALPELPYACGLETISLLTDDVTASSLRAVGGELPVERVEVDETALERVGAAAGISDWWHRRLTRALKHLGEEQL